MATTRLTDEVQIALGNLADFAGDLVTPSIRLGVTGLSRSGKTIFITALVHNLLHGGRLPLFEAQASGRLARAGLSHQPNDTIPRFAYEDHIRSLLDDRVWPQSTRQVSELRITLEYESASYFSRTFGPGKLHLDIIDYPGEWLLDLALLDQSFDEWAQSTMALWEGRDSPGARHWTQTVSEVDPAAGADEPMAARLAQAYREALSDARGDPDAPLIIAPGRFLMPGELEGSPALTFSPLPAPDGGRAGPNSLWAMMERRYESYKTHVAKPFFREHFARLDRQIVLVDALSALNRGPEAIAELSAMLERILATFRPGKRSWLAPILGRRIDRVVFAATKADHLHHESHDRLEAILASLTDAAISRAETAGAEVKVVALAALRTTREGKVRDNGEELPCIIGTPMAGQTIDGKTFDGATEAAIFPGELPEDPRDALKGLVDSDAHWQFVRFRPPDAMADDSGNTSPLPHIRLDRALEVLLTDNLA